MQYNIKHHLKSHFKVLFLLVASVFFLVLIDDGLSSNDVGMCNRPKIAL